MTTNELWRAIFSATGEASELKAEIRFVIVNRKYKAMLKKDGISKRIPCCTLKLRFKTLPDDIDFVLK